MGSRLITAEKKRQGRPPVIENDRDRILDEAAALFARSGYERSSVGDVADAIGATKAAIYHYFDSKQDIYDAIIVRTLTGLAARVRAAVGDSGTAQEKLRRYMTAHATYLE